MTLLKKLLVLAALLNLAWARLSPSTLYTINSPLDLPDANLNDPACATAPSPAVVCTLRAAVMQANAHPGADFILVPAGTYVITRMGDDATASAGDLDVTDPLTILGNGTVVIDANGGVTHDRAFDLITTTLSLQNLTIENGNAAGAGGAIRAQGSLSLDNVTLQNNSAALDGGGLDVQGSPGDFAQVIIADSVISNNRALGGSGGGLASDTATGSIQNTTFQNNSASFGGGGLSYQSSYVGLTLSVAGSTIFSNSVAGSSGGGAYLNGNTFITSTQVISNAAPSGGGISANYGTHNLTDVRVLHNHATSYACGGIQLTNGNLNLIRGWVDGNTAPAVGGGLCTGGAGEIRLAITDTNVLNNRASQGGGVWVGNSFFATRSALYDNSATRGGGLYAQGQAILENTTVSDNSAGRDGGGVYADGGAVVRLFSATLATNRARTQYPQSGIGGGIYISATAVVSAANTLISQNSNSGFAISYSDCAGTLRSEAYNFVSTTVACSVTGDPTGNQLGGNSGFPLNPQVEPLALITGLTPGLLPDNGSPLINAAAPVGCQSAAGGFLFVDQIGHFRSGDGRCDIGAVEYFAIQHNFLPAALK